MLGYDYVIIDFRTKTSLNKKWITGKRKGPRTTSNVSIFIQTSQKSLQIWFSQKNREIRMSLPRALGVPGLLTNGCLARKKGRSCHIQSPTSSDRGNDTPGERCRSPETPSPSTRVRKDEDRTFTLIHHDPR